MDSSIDEGAVSLPIDSVNSATGMDSESSSTEPQRLDGLRILFAIDSTFPRLGGAEAQALKLAISMRKRGAHIEFVAPRISKSEALEEAHQGFRIRRIDYPHVRFVGSLLLMRNFGRYLQDNAHRFDAVHVHITHLMAATAGFVRHKTQLPVTTKISGFYEFEGGVLDQTKRFKPLNYLLRRGLKKVDFVQTISGQTREKLLAAKFRDEQIRFVPNGIDTGMTPSTTPSADPKIIGYCGRLREVKGVQVLLDAFAQVQAQRPDAGLKVSIAGSGSQSDELLAQSERLGLTQHVEWLGMIEDTHSYFQSIDIYVQPSFAEGLPNSIMEAMVAQKPVVASDIGGNNDLVEHEVSGLRFDVGNASSLAEQLIRMIDDAELRETAAAAGRDIMVKNFDIDSVITQLVTLYRA